MIPSYMFTVHLCSQLLAATNLFSVSMNLPCLDTSCSEIVQYCYFLGSFHLVSVMFLKFIQVIANINNLFLFIGEQYSVAWMYHSFCINSPVGGYLNCFQFGAIMNNVAINICVQVLCGHLLGRYLGMESNDKFMLNFLRNCQNIF